MLCNRVASRLTLSKSWKSATREPATTVAGASMFLSFVGWLRTPSGTFVPWVSRERERNATDILVQEETPLRNPLAQAIGTRSLRSLNRRVVRVSRAPTVPLSERGKSSRQRTVPISRSLFALVCQCGSAIGSRVYALRRFVRDRSRDLGRFPDAQHRWTLVRKGTSN